MYTLFNIKYVLTTTLIANNSFLSKTSLNNIIRSVTQFMLNADFDNDKESLDEIEYYTSKNPANK